MKFMKTWVSLILIILVRTSSASAIESAQLIQRSERPLNIEIPLELFDQEGGLTKNEHFFVRSHLANIPKVESINWKLELKGDLFAKPMSFSLLDLKKKFKKVELVALTYCSGNRRALANPRVPGVQWNIGAMGNARWGGVRLKDLLSEAGLKPEAVELVFDGADQPVLEATPDFRKSLPIKKALDENTIIAFEMNGKLLPENQGFPARLVVPGWTATYWVKQLVSIEGSAKPFDGFWMKTAYRIPKGKFAGDSFSSQDQPETSAITSILVNSLITNLKEGQKVKKGHLKIKGLAWDGGSGIEKVEISTDNGQSWKSAKLNKDLGNFSWREFKFTLPVKDSGTKIIQARATNKMGQTQSDQLIPNPGGYHHNLIQQLKIEVE